MKIPCGSAKVSALGHFQRSACVPVTLRLDLTACASWTGRNLLPFTASVDVVDADEEAIMLGSRSKYGLAATVGSLSGSEANWVMDRCGSIHML